MESSHLAEKHQGMSVDISGTFFQIKKYLNEEPGLVWALNEFEKHLDTVSERFYQGKISIVDEFLQLYCKDATRPNK